MLNNILDYEQAEEKMQQIAQKGTIEELEPLAITKCDLPIRHFITGNGEKDIVITGATHGSEIISTDFIIKLMEEINSNPSNWKQVLENYKIHFIPMLNPEGYLISTSAVRKLIPRNMSQEEAEKICKEYYRIYRLDTTDPDKTSTLKRHQAMFEGVDYSCIPDKYAKVKESVKEIFEKYPDLPKWCLHIWSANASGIDIQANSEHNPQIQQILQGGPIYMNAIRFDNIDISHPGPINCPFDKEKPFEYEIETQAISNLLNNLHNQNKLFAYLNYHSTGGLIFQRPAKLPEGIVASQDEMSKKEVQNYMFAKLYSDKTYKNKGLNSDGIDKSEKTKYTIQKGLITATSSNDVFRILYPQDILIELSAMGGNPIAPYGDIEGNYTNSIQSNLAAVEYTLKVASAVQMISNNFYKSIQQFDDKGDYDQLTHALDLIYAEFTKRLKQFEPQMTTPNTHRKDETNIDER